jgi:hypothetical protein
METEDQDDNGFGDTNKQTEKQKTTGNDAIASSNNDKVPLKVEDDEFAHNVRPTTSRSGRQSSTSVEKPLSPSRSLPCLTDESNATDCTRFTTIRSDRPASSHPPMTSVTSTGIGQLSLDNGTLHDPLVSDSSFNQRSLDHNREQSKRRPEVKLSKHRMTATVACTTRRSKQRRSRAIRRSKSAQSNMLLQRSLSCSVGMMAPTPLRAPRRPATQECGETRHRKGHEPYVRLEQDQVFFWSSSFNPASSSGAKSFAHAVSSSSSFSASSKSSLIGAVPLNGRQRLILTSLCCLAFTSQCSMSIIAPFFPFEASAKGISESVYGLVFSVHALVVVVFSPLFGKMTLN